MSTGDDDTTVERGHATLRVAELEADLIAAKQDGREDLAQLKSDLRVARWYLRSLRAGVPIDKMDEQLLAEYRSSVRADTEE
jgi:hypothetical protein